MTMTFTRASNLAGALLVALLPVAPASAATLNVAELVTGVAESLPIHPGTRIECGGACRYAAVSSTGMSNSYTTAPGPYQLGAWPVQFGSAQLGYIAVEESLPVPAPPAGSVAKGLNNGVLQRAAVDYDDGPLRGAVRRLSVQTWKTGSGASSVSYAVRINTPVDGPRRTYLEFTVPTLTRSWVHAWALGGPSGYELDYSHPERLQTRSAVDVYVDGLPVWTAQRNFLVPQRYHPSVWSAIDLDWGQTLGPDPALGAGKATLFLGTLPAKSTRTVVLVMRTDVRVDAPTCRSTTEYGSTTQRCSAQFESLTLPSIVPDNPFQRARPDIAIYTR